MRIIAGIVSKQGALDVTSLHRRLGLAERGLPFAGTPYLHTTWVGDSGGVALAVWDNDIEPPGGQSLVINGGVAQSVAGYVVDPEIHDAWDVTEITRKFRFTPVAATQIGGAFALFEAISSPPGLLVLNTISKLEPVFWMEKGSEIVVSNRALVAHLVSTGNSTPDIDESVAGMFAAEGFFRTNVTPYAGVVEMPANHLLLADAHGVLLEPLDDYEDQVGELAAGDDAAELLIENLRRAIGSRGNRPVFLSLSGGKDSRLVGAVLRSCGVEAVASTRGFPGNPEVVVASQLAERLRFPHEVSSPFTIDPGDTTGVDPIARVELTLRRCDGMMSGWENVPPATPLRPVMTTGGQGAAPIKGLAAAAFHGKRTPDNAQMRRAMKGRLSRADSLLLPDASAQIDSWIDSWIERHHELDRYQILERYYIDTMNGRWMSALKGSYSDTCSQLTLYDNQVARTAMRVSTKGKMDELFQFKILQKLAPDLTTIPVERKRWLFERDGPRDGDERAWQQRTPVEAESGTRASFDWRHLWTTTLFDVFFEQIFANRHSSRLFNQLDRVKTEEWFLSKRGSPPIGSSSLIAWSILSASVLVENRWLEGNRRAHSTSVTVPPS